MNSDGYWAPGEVPVFVTGISFLGLRKTDPEFLKRQLPRLVKSENLRELLRNCSELKQMLMGLNIFHSVQLAVDVDSKSSIDDAYEVSFIVQERKPQTLKAQWTVNTDGAMRLGGYYSLNNIFRKGERLQIDLSMGRDASALRSASFTKPLENNPTMFFTFGGSEGTYDHWWSRFLRHEKSLFAEFLAPSRFGVHRISWSYLWRELEASGRNTPWAVRMESGQSMRMNLRHQVEFDTRSDRIFPDDGLLLRLTKDLTFITPGPPSGCVNNSLGAADDEPARGTPVPPVSNAIQFRWESLLQCPFRLTSWLVGELTFSTGLVHSLTRHPVSIADRFFLGGPLDFRGFKFCGVGPSEPLLIPRPVHSEFLLEPTPQPADDDINRSPVGALGSWLAGAHLYSPLPLWGAAQNSMGSLFRLHAFAMTGSLISDPVAAAKRAHILGQYDRLVEFLDIRPRYVLGAGLILRFAQMARLELNYCLPMSSQPGDGVQRGFQLGIGVSYM
ncbi:sorting and assembly machinery component 50 [Sparganum proliferum]